MNTLAVDLGELLGTLHTVREPLRHRAQRKLGIDVQPPGDVDRGEQHIAELLEDVRVGLGLRRGLPCGLERLLQLAELVLQVGEGARRVGVLELDRSRPALQLAGVEQRRERLGNVVKDPFPPLVGALDLLPVRAHSSGRLRLDLSEHVRVPPHKLGVDPAGRLLEVPMPILFEQQRQEVDLEEQVAELVE